jgi:hypothetical protein
MKINGWMDSRIHGTNERSIVENEKYMNREW